MRNWRKPLASPTGVKQYYYTNVPFNPSLDIVLLPSCLHNTISFIPRTKILAFATLSQHFLSFDVPPVTEEKFKGFKMAVIHDQILRYNWRTVSSEAATGKAGLGYQ